MPRDVRHSGRISVIQLSYQLNAVRLCIGRKHRRSSEQSVLQCVHHIPGRLRLKGPSLRGDAVGLDAMCRSLLATKGVTAVAPSLFTGSILVTYDPAVLQPAVLDGQLQRLGSRSGIRPQPDEGSFERVVETIVRRFFEHMVEALAAAAIEAAI